LHLLALVIDKRLGVVVEVEPEIDDVSIAHEGVESLIDALDITVTTGGVGSTGQLVDGVANWSKVVIVEYVHLIIGQAYGQVGEAWVRAT
jgi:hypothetical protein